MELWIRSQDKDVLIRVNRISFERNIDDEPTIYGYENYDNYERLGVYKTKERALEILDIIQTLLTYSTATVGQLKDAFKDYKELPKVSINSIGVVVYEMPEQ